MNRKTRGEVGRILRSAGKVREIGERIDSISAHFLGLPYAVNSLGGGPGLTETLVVRLDAFDCVTYMETVLALALADAIDEFAETLTHIRYRDGAVGWGTRNHYMVDWWRTNEAAGRLQNLTIGSEAVEKNRVLNLVEGLPKRRVTYNVFPKGRYARIAGRIESGDLVCFASAKKNLDVFHTGILIRRRDEVLLRHATRTAGRVIEQSLREFLGNHRMSGLVLLRPDLE